MSTPKRQHYVPRFYLENFARPGTPGSTPGFWIYQKTTDAEPRWGTSGNTAIERYLYTITREGVKDHTLETVLSEVEGNSAPIIQKWLMDGALPSIDDIARLVEFVACMATRGPRSIDAVREMSEVFATEMLKDLGEHPEELRRVLADMKADGHEMPPEDKVQEALRNSDERFRLKVDRQSAMVESMKLTQSVADCLRRMHWSLCVSESSQFITSDTPLCAFVKYPNGEAIFGGGFGDSRAEVTLPLSPAVCLLISYRTSQERIRAGDTRVREYNRRTAFIAERFVIASERTDTTAALVTEEAGRSIGLPKMDRAELGALMREAIERFRPR